MPVLIVVPRVNSKLGSFWRQITWFFFVCKSDAFSEKKKPPGRAAPHRRPSWGCTKTNPEWECSNSFQILSNWPWTCMGPFSENHQQKLDDMTLGSARVPKIIPMQVQGGLRGPFDLLCKDTLHRTSTIVVFTRSCCRSSIFLGKYFPKHKIKPPIRADSGIVMVDGRC